MFERKKYKSFAKMQLKGRWKVPILMTLIAIVVTSLFSLPDYINYPYNDFYYAAQTGNFQGFFIKYNQAASSSSLLLSLVQLLVSFIFAFVASRVYIKLSQNPDKVLFSDYLQNFNFWGRAIITHLWQFLWLLLWSLTLLPILFIGAFIYVVIFNLDADSITTVTTSMLVLTGICTFIWAILITIKSLSYSMMIYIAAEHEKCSVAQSLNISKIITKGHIWDLFVLDLSFLGWHILSLITFGIASLWVTPYVNMTKVNAYHSLLKEAFDKDLIHVEDFE